MRRLSLLFTLLAVFCAASAIPGAFAAGGSGVARAQAAVEVGTGRIQGRLTAPIGSALQDPRVTAWFFNSEEDDWELRQTVTPSSDGSYELVGLSVGQWRVGFRDAGSNATLAQEWWENALSVESARDIDLTAGQLVANIDAELAVAGRIEGRVTAQSGDPVQNGSVQIFHQTAEGWRGLTSASPDPVTGAYTVSRVPPGTYRVLFMAGTYQYQTVGILAYQYWGNVADISIAKDVVVQGGATVSGVDAELVAGASIRGSVTNSAATPLITDINAYHLIEGQWLPVYSGAGGEVYSNGSTGAFNLAGMPAGTYRLKIESDDEDYLPEFWRDSATLDGAISIGLGTGQVISGIDVTLNNVTDTSTPPPTPTEISTPTPTETSTPTTLPVPTATATPTTPPTVAPTLSFGASKLALSGKPRVGKSLTAVPGSVSPAGYSVKYQWLRNGKAIKKATKPRYKLTIKDKGKKVRLKAVYSLPGAPSVTRLSIQKRIS